MDRVTGNERFQDFLDGCGKDLWRLRDNVGALAHQRGHSEGSVQLLQTQRHIAGVKGAQDVEERGFAIAARPNQEEGLLKADRHQRAGHRLLKECTHLQVGLKEIQVLTELRVGVQRLGSVIAIAVNLFQPQLGRDLVSDSMLLGGRQHPNSRPRRRLVGLKQEPLPQAQTLSIRRRENVLVNDFFSIRRRGSTTRFVRLDDLKVATLEGNDGPAIGLLGQPAFPISHQLKHRRVDAAGCMTCVRLLLALQSQPGKRLGGHVLLGAPIPIALLRKPTEEAAIVIPIRKLSADRILLGCLQVIGKIGLECLIAQGCLGRWRSESCFGGRIPTEGKDIVGAPIDTRSWCCIVHVCVFRFFEPRLAPGFFVDYAACWTRLIHSTSA